MFKYPKPHFCTSPLSPPGSGDSVRRCARSRAILGIVVQMPGYTELPFPGCSAAGLPQCSLPSVSEPSPPSCHRFLSLCSYSWCTRDGPEQGLRSPEKHFRFQVTSGWVVGAAGRARGGGAASARRSGISWRAGAEAAPALRQRRLLRVAGRRPWPCRGAGSWARRRAAASGCSGPGAGVRAGGRCVSRAFLKKMHAAFPLDDGLCFP